MIVLLRKDAEAPAVKAALIARGLWVRRVETDGADGRLAFIVDPSSAVAPIDELDQLPGVEAVLASRSPHPKVDAQATTTTRCSFSLAAGPCSVESEAQIARLAETIAAAGGRYLRGGAFKPRTSPYAFNGHGLRALRWLRDAADGNGLSVVTEALDEGNVSAVAEVADLIQVGSRNMANYALLRAIGQTGKPVLLKRGLAATIDEWLLAGEHLLDAGSERVVFCERGVRHFDPTTRNCLDLGAVALLTHVHHQPVYVDPSHAAGRRDLILPLARAAKAAGALATSRRPSRSYAVISHPSRSSVR
ncbi:MAG: 3-deoxy-7-phosphoheptulonate synthase [Proteobacteria bacterium]|nr:MAG: 3-deoxy-7-phosphoheptulonate synthase [Pseudomonadota bacterium]